MIKSEDFSAWIALNKARIIERLITYIAINTVSPCEKDSFVFLHNYLQDAGFSLWEQPLHRGVISHPYSCPSAPSFAAIGEAKNLCASYTANRTTKTILVSCHIDVVPAPNWPNAFKPLVENDIVYGRGACDTKGNMVMFVEAINFLRAMDIPVTKNICFDAVIEEETGGNGALSTILYGEAKPDGVLVLEPTSLRLYRGHRGCLGFSLTISGSGAHMGSSASSLGPVQAAAHFVSEMEVLEKYFIEEAHSESAFAEWKRPVQINIGRIEGGEWHGTTVDKCRLMVNMGFPHSYDINRSMAVVEEIVARLRAKGSHLNYKLAYDGIRNDAYLDAADSTFIEGMKRALSMAGLEESSVNAWHVSCDARTYAKGLQVPTLIFGCGHLRYAHSNHEQLDVNDLIRGIQVLAFYFAESH